MVFSSLLFSFFFLPLVIILYFLAKDKYRNYILLIASLFFYSYGEPRFVFVMGVSIVLNYLLALAIVIKKDKGKYRWVAKSILVVDIVFNIGILFVFKYLDFSILAANRFFNTNIQMKNIALPIGISFLLFKRFRML